jgi:hypothetical protein
MNNNQKFDQDTVNKVIESLSSATKTKVTRKARNPRAPSELQKTLDALLSTVEQKIKDGVRKKDIYSSIVKGGIAMSSGTFNKWLKTNGLTRKSEETSAS